MNKIRMYVNALLMLLLCFSCSGRKGTPSKEADIRIRPEELACAPEKGATASLLVTASDAWEAYSNDSWVASVSPRYSASPSGTVTVVVDENPGKTPRTGTVVIKCGTTRRQVSLVQAGKPEDTSIEPPEGYRLVWHDEFDEPAVNSGNWRFENWAPGQVNHELQRYVAGGELDGDKTAFIEDGALVIRAMKHGGQVISARMNSRTSWLYGYMEARISLPAGKGTWPAFWMMPEDQSDGWPKCGEIDIMEEVGYHPDYTSSSIHCESYNHMIGTQKTKERLCSGAEGNYHIYALRWTKDAIRSYVDGKELLVFDNDGKNNVSTWPFDKAFFIILNLAWGGDWGGAQGVDESALPCTMKVDYVRVFQEN